MARAKQNGLFDAFTEKKVTYHRSAAQERRDKAAKDKAHAKAMREHMVELQEQIAYDRGKDDKERGRKADVRMDHIVAIGTGEWLTKTAAYPIAKREYMKGYRQNPARKNGKRNPVDAAADLSEAWHGRPAETETDYVERVRFHGVLTDLGRLKEIKVLVTARKAQAIRFDAETRLASSENGKQLYVVGGDQSLDLGALGIGGEESDKDLVVVGPVYSVTYITSKYHLGKEDKIPGPYEHEMGEGNGIRPLLVYDRLNEEVGFAGGSYKIVPDDYDGRHSAGIRN